MGLEYGVYIFMSLVETVSNIFQYVLYDRFSLQYLSSH